MLTGSRIVARMLVELGEPELAARDERTHAARFGQRLRLTKVSLATHGIEPLRMRRDLAQQVPRVRGKSRMTGRALDGARRQAHGVVEPAQPQAGMTQYLVVPAAPPDDSPRRKMRQKLLALVGSIQRLAWLAELRESQGREGERGG